MPSLRRAVIRLLLVTAFLLLFAWIALKGMQYKWDWGKVFHDIIGDTSGIERFFNEQVTPRLREVGAFFTEKLGPWVEKTASDVKDSIGL